MTLRLKPQALRLLEYFKKRKTVDEQERHERLEVIRFNYNKVWKISNEELQELTKQLQPMVKNPF